MKLIWMALVVFAMLSASHLASHKSIDFNKIIGADAGDPDCNATGIYLYNCPAYTLHICNLTFWMARADGSYLNGYYPQQTQCMDAPNDCMFQLGNKRGNYSCNPVVIISGPKK